MSSAVPPGAVRSLVAALFFLPLGAVRGSAQVPVTRRDAIASAVARGPRVLVAAPDTAIARGQLGTARAFQNPTFSAEYSRSAPRRHFTLELPLDFPWIRSARVGAAQSAAGASRFRFAQERAGARFDATTAYTRALAARAHAGLSRRSAAEGDTLFRMTVLRRDAGDASELEVQLANVSAGQLANDAERDSIDALAALLDLQVAMGLAGDSVLITLADSLQAPPATATPLGSPVLAVAAAEAELAASERSLALEQRNLLPAPSVHAGAESGDPGEPGVLALVGFSIPLPLLNQNRGPVRVARANRDLAARRLEVARRESASQIARASRELAAAQSRVERGRALVQSANQVTAMSRTAFVEGAAGLATVLESRRNARDALGRYIDDVAAANLAQAALELATATEGP